MFKWVCLLVAMVALTVFGWMLNDMRVQIKETAERLDRQVSPLFVKAERITDQLDNHLPKLISQSEQTSNIVTRQLPKLIQQTEQAAQTINSHLPGLLAQTQQAVGSINQNLPKLLAGTERAVDGIGDLSDGFKQYQGLLGAVHVASQNKDLFSYGSSILGLIGGLDAKIGTKKKDDSGGLTQAMPAKQWAVASKKNAHFLSLAATSKAEMLHGLARTTASAPWHIQIGDGAPRLLADWILEKHPESKDVK